MLHVRSCLLDYALTMHADTSLYDQCDMIVIQARNTPREIAFAIALKLRQLVSVLMFSSFRIRQRLVSLLNLSKYTFLMQYILERYALMLKNKQTELFPGFSGLGLRLL